MVIAEEKRFLSGVVEGFYGRPWTCSQRRELFFRMRKSSMNTYIYAPKDDTKHRALWRQLYTKEEECKLKILIDAANNEGVTFVYAISPGLDIAFSSEADVAALKRKMKQVAKLGCGAFALLFDDIIPTLKPSDAVAFESSAHAQAALTNELYVYLKKPQFLFCPTEYCKTRAVPNVKTSLYLNTLGKELFKDINIMWTGDKVIPKTITKESIQELGEVLQRKPVIWDNIHANDYDQRRVYLGAYCGRPVELYPYLNGILTNPNCEFEANFVAIHTLGTWYKIASSTFNHNETFDVHMEDLSDDDNTPVSNNDCVMPVDLIPHLTAADVSSVVSSEYCPKQALKLAICDWLDEFGAEKKAPLKSYSKRNLQTTVINGQTVLTAVPYELDVAEEGNQISDVMDAMVEDKLKQGFLSDDDLQLFVDLFCLPYEHGERGEVLLKEFSWLIENVSAIYKQPPSKEMVSQWFDRLLRCDEHCQDVYKLFKNFCKIPNEAIIYDLYPYLWDLKEVVLALDSYVHWLSDSMTSCLSVDSLAVVPSSERPVQQFPVLDEFIEPWHEQYLGGLTIALHKLLPFRGGYMFLDHAPDIPSSNVVRTRTYTLADKTSVYKFCSDICKTKPIDNSENNVENTVQFESEIGCVVSACPETFFLVEDESGVCGYIGMIPDNKRYNEHIHSHWMPVMKEKHANVERIRDYTFSKVDGWNLSKSSHLVLKLDDGVRSECVLRRILSSALSVLKASGAISIFHELDDIRDVEIYRRLGFFPADEQNPKLLWRYL